MIDKMNATLTIHCAGKKFEVHVPLGPQEGGESKPEDAEESSSEATLPLLRTVGELRDFIAENGNFDGGSAKIVFRGKFIGTDREEPLENYRFKKEDKCMVMGLPKAHHQDSGFTALLDYEKKYLTALREVFEKNDVDLTELEKNFLDDEKQKEMIKRMEKRLKHFADTSMKHLENLDGIQIYNDETSDEQKQRNREKRKELIQGVQDLLNLNDKFEFRLSQYAFKLEHPDEGH